MKTFLNNNPVYVSLQDFGNLDGVARCAVAGVPLAAPRRLRCADLRHVRVQRHTPRAAVLAPTRAAAPRPRRGGRPGSKQRGHRDRPIRITTRQHFTARETTQIKLEARTTVVSSPRQEASILRNLQKVDNNNTKIYNKRIEDFVRPGYFDLFR